MKIVIAGSGAMGCRYGAALFESGHEVTLLDGWAAHVAAINEGGLRVTLMNAVIKTTQRARELMTS